MFNPIDQLPRTALAATAWTGRDNKLHIRVYFQDKAYDIREARWDGEEWTGGQAKDTIVYTARYKTPLAATNWYDGNKVSRPTVVEDEQFLIFWVQIHIRVYYLSPEN